MNSKYSLNLLFLLATHFMCHGMQTPEEIPVDMQIAHRQIQSRKLYNAVSENNIQKAEDALRSRFADPNDLEANDRYQRNTVLEIATKHQNEQLVELLLQYGAQPNLLPHYGLEFPLDIAAEKGNITLVKRLLRAGASPNEWKKYLEKRPSDPSSMRISLGFRLPPEPTLICAARTENNAAILETLLNAGAKINDADWFRTMALMRAAFKGAINNVRFLLERGAEPNLEDTKGKKALDYARLAGNDDDWMHIPRTIAHDEIVNILEPITSRSRYDLLKGVVAALQERLGTEYLQEYLGAECLQKYLGAKYLGAAQKSPGAAAAAPQQ